MGKEARSYLESGTLAGPNQYMLNAGAPCPMPDDKTGGAHVAVNGCLSKGGTRLVEGVVVSPWVVHAGYCAFRHVKGADPNDVRNRVAFIEKTPRVRVAPYKGPADVHSVIVGDGENWECGPKGAGGSGGEKPENELYGFYPPSRLWCDARLQEMGYILED